MPISLTRIEFYERLEKRSKLLQLALAHVVQHTKKPITVPGSGDIYLNFCKGLEPIVYETMLRMIEGVYQED